MPNAVSRECRIKKPPCIVSSLPSAKFWGEPRGITGRRASILIRLEGLGWLKSGAANSALR
jgi:hypothetical protein